MKGPGHLHALTASCDWQSCVSIVLIAHMLCALRELLTEELTEEHVWISQTVGQHNLLEALSGRVQKAVGLVKQQ